MLALRDLADLGAVGLGLEAEADARTDLLREVEQVAVLGGARDREVQGLVGGAGGLAVAVGGEVGVVRGGDRGDVFGPVALGGRACDHRLDEAAQVEKLLEGGPVGADRALHALGRVGPPVGAHEGAAVAAAADLDVARRGEAVEGFADARAVDAEHRREVALGRQALAGHVLAERDRGDEAVGDELARVAQAERRKRARVLGRLEQRDRGHVGAPCSQAGIRRASVRAPAAMLAISTPSSTPWMLQQVGPKQTAEMPRRA